MKEILVTVMLLIVVIALYNATIGGADGGKKRVRDGGSRINVTIQSISP